MAKLEDLLLHYPLKSQVLTLDTFLANAVSGVPSDGHWSYYSSYGANCSNERAWAFLNVRMPQLDSKPEPTQPTGPQAQTNNLHTC